MTSALHTVLAYHERTKHQFQRYADGPGRLDWATQPDPFRTFTGAAQLTLPLLDERALDVRYVELYERGSISPWPMTLTSVGALLELALGLSAWKQYGDTRWALRCNPSSGNLHPTEAYVVVQSCSGIPDGVHHYLSRDHLLEQRCVLRPPVTLVSAGGFYVGLTSIHWREAWKYGERAFRYCQHDVGHAVAAVAYAAAVLGWQTRALINWSDEAIAALLGLDRDADFGEAERETADVLLWVGNQAPTVLPVPPTAQDLASITAEWSGKANRLSLQHSHHWPVIEEVAAACAKPVTEIFPTEIPPQPDPLPNACRASAFAIIKQRRSAQAFDAVTGIDAATFYRFLDMTLPRSELPPWSALPRAPRLHLALFVHRIADLDPGVYLFLRNKTSAERIRAELHPEFEWARPASCPHHLLLYRLVTAEAGQAAQALSCHQDIAADGAFSLGMLAEYEASLANGPWSYRELFWEAGMLGQVLYLEAEAAGMRGTGIGCYFDDPVHDLLGMRGHGLQSLYHFTVGRALADERLQTLPPYAHLQGR